MSINTPPVEPDELPVYDSDRRLPAALEELLGLFRFRDLVLELIRCDLVARYKRSYFGIVWTMLNPIGTTLVLVVALARAFGPSTTYALHVMTGLMVWNFISYGTQAAISKCLAGSRDLPGVYVPRTAYAVAAIGTALVNLLLATLPLLLLLIACGQGIPATILLLPVALVLIGLFGLGVALAIASLSIRFTDVAQIYVMALPAWLYLTPVIYPTKVLEPRVAYWVNILNPLSPLIELYRSAFTGALPSLGQCALGTAGALVTLAIGWCAFTARSDELGRIA